jgi:hypothetical protein
VSTITIPRDDVTSEEIVEALRSGLDPRYDVQPGMRMPRSPLLGSPRPDEPEVILVAASPMVQTQVRIIHRSGHTDRRVTPGGVLGDLLMNTLGIARKVRKILANASELRAAT